MLAHAGRVGALCEALAVEGNRQRRHADRLAAGARFEQAAGGVEVGIIEQVPGLRDRRERHADRFQLGGELLLRVLARDLVEARDEPGALPDTRAAGAEAPTRETTAQRPACRSARRGPTAARPDHPA